MEKKRRLLTVLDVTKKCCRSITKWTKHNGHMQGKYIRGFVKKIFVLFYIDFKIKYMLLWKTLKILTHINKWTRKEMCKNIKYKLERYLEYLNLIRYYRRRE